MDRQIIEGWLKKTTGTIKEKAGEMTGNRHLESEGKPRRLKVTSAAAMDAVREVVEKE